MAAAWGGGGHQQETVTAKGLCRLCVARLVVAVCAYVFSSALLSSKGQQKCIRVLANGN